MSCLKPLADGLSVVRRYIMLMFKSSRLVYYPFADSSLFLTITLILGFFTLLSNLQVCVWQESTSSGSRAVLPQVSDSFSASADVVLDDVSWQQGKTIPLCQAGSCFLGIWAIFMSCWYSLILGLLSCQINRYVCGRVFMIESCVRPSQ